MKTIIQQLTEEIKKAYDDSTTAIHAASQLWVDAIIDPRKTREVLSLGIEMANHGKIKKFNTGVIQV